MSEVCSDCVGDPYLRKYIKQRGSDGTCTYCKKKSPTIDARDLASLFETMLTNHYSPTASEPEGIDLLLAKEGMWEQAGEPLEDLLFQHLGGSEDLVRDVAEELTERWFDYDSHDHLYGEDPHFEERSPGHGQYGEIWAEAEARLRYEMRILPLETTAFLDSLFTIEDLAALTINLEPGIYSDRLFRARAFQSEEALSDALRDPEGRLGPPPVSSARPGRMNAQGISIFYGADTAETALAEVRPPVASHVLIGAFHPLRTLRILDLTKMLATSESGSLFDPKTLARLQRASFLRSFAAKLSAPVLPDRQAGDYLVTQAISDYLAARVDLALDGILYGSVQAHADGNNISLFHKASRVLRDVPKIDDVQLYEPSDESDFAPAFAEGNDILDDETASSGAPSEKYNDRRTPALRLDRETLTVHLVRGVTFDVASTKVTLYKST